MKDLLWSIKKYSKLIGREVTNMESVKLYKYLDAEGGLAMLSNGNIQFTNATKLNDPFDCHPSLIDFSQVPTSRYIK